MLPSLNEVNKSFGHPLPLPNTILPDHPTCHQSRAGAYSHDHGHFVAPEQLTDPRVNFALVHVQRPVTVHICVSLPRATSRGGLAVAQDRVTSFAEVIFLPMNRTQNSPCGKSSPRMLIINIWNKFQNKKFQKAAEIGKRV